MLANILGSSVEGKNSRGKSKANCIGQLTKELDGKLLQNKRRKSRTKNKYDFGQIPRRERAAKNILVGESEGVVAAAPHNYLLETELNQL